MKKKIVILGAGFAGLAAALDLLKKGYDVSIIDKESYVGGLCTTFQNKGFYFDVGGHRLYTKSEQIFNFLNDLLGKDAFIERKRISRIYLKGHFFEYPLKLMNVIFNQSLKTVLSIGRDFIIIQFKSIFNKEKNNKENFESWVVSRFGKTLYTIYFKEYTEKVWKEDPQNLHKELAERRISFTHLKEVVNKLLGFSKGETPRTYITELYYPKHGIGDVAEGFKKAILSLGGKFYLETDIKEVLKDTRGYATHISCKSSHYESFKLECDYLLSTIPIISFIKYLRSGNFIKLEKKVEDQIRYQGIICLYLMVNKILSFSDTWLYIPEQKYIIFRIVNFTNWSPYMSPENKTSLCLEISVNHNSIIDYDMIYDEAIRNLEELDLLKKENIEGHFFKEFKHAYPVYTTNYKSILSEMDESLKSLNNILTFGRQGAFNYTTMDNTLRVGFEVANHIAKIDLEKASTLYDDKFSLLNDKFQEI